MSRDDDEKKPSWLMSASDYYEKYGSDEWSKDKTMSGAAPVSWSSGRFTK